MSSADLAIIVAAVIAACGAIGAAMVSLTNNRRLGEIHILVNSNLAAVKNRLQAAENEIAHLNVVIAQLRKGEAV